MLAAPAGELALALFLYALVVWGALALVGFRPGEYFLGGEFSKVDWDLLDWNIHYWNLWEFRRVYLGEASPFHTSFQFYPSGLWTIGVHGDLGVKLISGLLALFMGPAQTYLSTILLMLLGNAMGGYVLVRWTARSSLAAFVAGLVLCFAGATAWSINSGNLEYGLWLWICLYLASFQRLLSKGQWRDVPLSALFAVLAILSNFVFFYPLVFFSLVLLLGRFRSMDRRRLIKVGAMVLVSGALLLPVVITFIQGERPGQVDSGAQLSLFPQRVMAIQYDNSPHPGEYLPWSTDRKWGDSAVFYVSWLLLALSLILCFKRTIPWVAAGLVFVLLSLGPFLFLEADSGEHGGTMPYYWAARLLPLFHHIRFPHRLSSFVIIALVVASGFGVARAMELVPGRARILLSAALLVLCLLEVNLRWDLRLFPRTPSHSFYQQLSRMPGRFGVVNFPLDYGIIDSIHLHHQIVHNKPLFNGSLPRYHGNAAFPNMAMLKSNLLLKTAYDLQTPLIDHIPEFIHLNSDLKDGQAFNPRELRVAEGFLAHKGLRYLILHRKIVWGGKVVVSLPRGTRLEKFLKEALGEPVFEDDTLLAFELHRDPLSAPPR